MKNFALIVFISFNVSFVLLGQNNDSFDSFRNIYGIRANVISTIYSNKCDCCVKSGFTSNKCTLIEVEIIEVFLMGDSSVYKDQSKLKNVIYLSHDLKDSRPVQPGKEYLFYTENSCSKEVLIITAELDRIPDPLPKFNPIARITGLGQCKDFTLLQKFLLFLNINREKIYEKAKDLSPEESVFVQALKERN